MKTVLFFISNARNGFSAHLEGIHAYAHRRNWHVQVVSRAMTKELVRESIAFWKPIGVLVEYDGQSVLRDSRLFGDIPVVSFDTGQTKPRRGRRRGGWPHRRGCLPEVCVRLFRG